MVRGGATKATGAKAAFIGPVSSAFGAAGAALFPAMLCSRFKTQARTWGLALARHASSISELPRWPPMQDCTNGRPTDSLHELTIASWLCEDAGRGAPSAIAQPKMIAHSIDLLQALIIFPPRQSPGLASTILIGTASLKPSAFAFCAFLFRRAIFSYMHCGQYLTSIASCVCRRCGRSRFPDGKFRSLPYGEAMRLGTRERLKRSCASCWRKGPSTTTRPGRY